MPYVRRRETGIDYVLKGSSVFAQLQEAQRHIRLNLAELEKSSSEFDKKMDDLISQRGEEFFALAAHYLPNLTQHTVERSFQEVRSELRDLFGKKQDREFELQREIELARQTIIEAQSEIDRVTDELNEKALERDRLQEVVSEKLKQIPEYEDLTNQAAKAEQRLTQNEERMEQVHNEAAEKLPSFENSRLFMYLHERKFGTVDYKSKGLIRYLDRRLAKYIDYRKSRRSYDFMKKTPGLMAAELKRRRDQFNELMETIEAMEFAVEQEVGLSEVIADGKRLGQKRDELVEKIDDQDKRLNEFLSELNASQQSRDQYYDQALAKMRSFLEQSEESSLEETASETEEPIDDRIVQDIVDLNRMIGDLQPEILLLVGKRKSLIEKQMGLDDIVNRFRSANYDSNRSVFPENLDIKKFVERYLNNELDAKSLWKHLRQNQKFRESWAQQTATDVINDPSAQIVMHTMLDLAMEALKHSARRSVYRRNSGRIGGGISRSGSRSTRRSRQARRPARRSSPRRRGGGFTTGDGF